MHAAKRKHSKKELLWGRIAAKTVFFMLGVGSGTFAANIPRLQETLHLTPGALGLALLCCSLGGFIAMQFAAPLIKRFGLRLLLAILAPSFPLVLAVIGFSNSFAMLAGAFVLFGALTSIAGIAVNAHAIDIEKAYAKSIMSSFHALFSIGGLAGAAAGGVMAAHYVSLSMSMTIVAIGLSILGGLVIGRLFDMTKYDYAEDHEVIESPHKHHGNRWWRNVLLFASLMFMCLLCEGAIADWSAIYMKSEHAAGPVVAVMAYMIFNCCMTIGRLMGDAVIRRFGALQMLVVGGTMGVIGLLIGLLSPSLVVALVGFGIVGLGVSIIGPILISMAGNLAGGDRNAAIARVSTGGSIGLMVGPAAIGFIADSSTLFMAMMLPVVLLTFLSVIATAMHKTARTAYRSAEVLN
jgi:MFS family permease